MKVILRGYGIGKTSIEKFNQRAQARDMTNVRGTSRVPGMPRDLFAQSGPSGILVNWRHPEGFTDDIAGWKIYRGDETSLYDILHDPGATQSFVASTSGSTPPNTNIFVSSFNLLGVESAKASIMAKAAVQTGAPSVPPTPQTFTTDFIDPSQ